MIAEKCLLNLRNGTYRNLPLDRQLDKIIAESSISIVFQPIASLQNGSVLGYEALCRGPEDTPLQYPDELFALAESCGKLWELEQLCRTKALELAFYQHNPGKLFLNVNPAVIYDRQFRIGFTKDYLSQYGIDPSDIIFELSEKGVVKNPDDFRAVISRYKKQNYKIAIDDMGSGYSGLNLITGIHPHFIKLDMNLIRCIDKDLYKKKLVKSLYDFSCMAGVLLIAEGIETEEELQTLVGIGVHYGQGYYLQEPQKEMRGIQKKAFRQIQAFNTHKICLCGSVSKFSIGGLCVNGVTLTPQKLLKTAYDCFQQDESLNEVTIVDENKQIVGTVSRMLIDQKMSGQYGFSLFAKKTIADIMDTNPLVVEYGTPIDAVAKCAMARPYKQLYDSIVIVKERVYCGTVSVKDLLEKTMEIEITNSRDLNPLSGLPGNLAIKKSIDKCIHSSDPFTILYIDLDNFKAYNDVYGFVNGDKIIRFLSKILMESISSEHFIGHVGGDDFVAILAAYEADDECEKIIRRFDKGIPAFYSAVDRKNGYITAVNRKGEEEKYPILSISIAGIRNINHTFHNADELAGYAGAMKKQCKLIWKSCYLIN